MSVEQLNILNFRNLANSKLKFHPKLNLIVGENGSGKSSILEAIFYLAHGKSFRTTKAEHIVTHNKKQFVVNIHSSSKVSLGISKDFISKILEIKVNGQRINKLSELAKNIAVQIVTPESFKLFFGGPKERRRFIDLGLFHVKHDFSNKWSKFGKLHKQRNACLRHKVTSAELSYWTDEFCIYSQILATDRADYIDKLQDELVKWLSILLPKLSDKIKIHYTRGWSANRKLVDVCLENNEREKIVGYSISGAHKFDVKFTLNKQPLDLVISRGQQKLFLLALTFAQAKLIEQVKQVKPILLIDDVGAELDIGSRTSLAKAIAALECQVVATAINEIDLDPLIQQSTVDNKDNYKMFHVKHGEISIE
ncbi:MAG: DNA replication/repair protein RecF [Gammaproteobacteria bacterium]|nr:MAG: DNA replication/repair protein RecF [Gammaproteobacteria bacterium]